MWLTCGAELDGLGAAEAEADTTGDALGLAGLAEGVADAVLLAVTDAVGASVVVGVPIAEPGDIGLPTGAPMPTRVGSVDASARGEPCVVNPYVMNAASATPQSAAAMIVHSRPPRVRRA